MGYNRSSGAKAAQRETSAASPEKLKQSEVNKKNHFLRHTAAQELLPGTSNQQKQGQSRKYPGNRDLPDIFTTEGKPLIQVKQRSIPGYVPAKRATSCLVTDNRSVEHLAKDWIPPEKEDKKTRLKFPKLKRKSKKKKKAEVTYRHQIRIRKPGAGFLESFWKVQNPSLAIIGLLRRVPGLHI